MRPLHRCRRDHCDQFINWHAECQKESKLPIVRLPDGREVLLLAMTVSDSNGTESLFTAHTVAYVCH